MDLLNNRVKELYEQQGATCRITKLVRALWCDESHPHQEFPCMRTKAAENRDLLMVVAQMCNDFNSGSQRDTLRLRAAVHLARVVSTFKNAGHFLTEGEYSTMLASMWAFEGAYMALARDAANNSILCFNVVNKHHMFAHLALSA
eukprot:15476843-Alexandrium_andersonii.AAC.1